MSATGVRARLRRAWRRAGRGGGRAVPAPTAPARPARKRYRYVFVVTYGRSGSTLVQGILNALPRVLVRGENGFYLLHLFRAAHVAAAFRRKHENHRPHKTVSAFYGLRAVRARRFEVATRTLVTDILIGPKPRGSVDVVGFKEVLWHQVEPEETEAFFAFVDATFPGARYVLNTRTHTDVAKSGFWRRHDDDEVMAAIRRVEEIQEFLRRTRPDRVLDLRYEVVAGEDRAASDAMLADLASFVVGRSDDALVATMREVLATGHGPFARVGPRPAPDEAGAGSDAGSDAT